MKLLRFVRSFRYYRYLKAKKLPQIPESITPLPYKANEQIKAVVVAGVNLLGERGYICPTVSIISFDQETGEMFGWSLCLGNPDPQFDGKLYYFRTSSDENKGTAKGTELPNTMLYFQAEIKPQLAAKDASPRELNKVLAYVLPYINDDGPPPAAGMSFDELVAKTPTSPDELDEAVSLLQDLNNLLDRASHEITDNLDYWELFEEINNRLQASGMNHAWKSSPSAPDYNPDLGTVSKVVAGRLITASIGLSKDRFEGPCAVIQIAN